MPSKRDQGSPPQYPATPPPSSSPGDFGYFETVMNLHAQVGGLKEAVDGLKEDVKELKAEQKEQGKKLDGIDKKIYAAVLIISVIISVVGFLLTLFSPTISNLIYRQDPPPAVQQPQQPQPEAPPPASPKKPS